MLDTVLDICIGVFWGGVYVAIISGVIILIYKTIAELVKKNHGYGNGIVFGIVLMIVAVLWGIFLPFSIPKYFTTTFTFITFAWSLIELSEHIEGEERRSQVKGYMQIFFALIAVTCAILIAEFKSFLINLDTSMIETVAFAIFIILLGLKDKELKETKEIKS